MFNVLHVERLITRENSFWSFDVWLFIWFFFFDFFDKLLQDLSCWEKMKFINQTKMLSLDSRYLTNQLWGAPIRWSYTTLCPGNGYLIFKVGRKNIELSGFNVVYGQNKLCLARPYFIRGLMPIFPLPFPSLSVTGRTLSDQTGSYSLVPKNELHASWRH